MMKGIADEELFALNSAYLQLLNSFPKSILIQLESFNVCSIKVFLQSTHILVISVIFFLVENVVQ